MEGLRTFSCTITTITVKITALSASLKSTVCKKNINNKIRLNENSGLAFFVAIPWLLLLIERNFTSITGYD
jgi:hypothetical protein